MPASIVYRCAGPVTAISVGSTSTAPLNVVPYGNDQVNYAEFLNPGSTQVCVVVAPIPTNGLASTPPIVFPVVGVPTVPPAFMLPATMTQGKLMAVPAGGFSVSAIGSAAGPSVIFITPMANQS
jgi:hypothetical protein